MTEQPPAQWNGVPPEPERKRWHWIAWGDGSPHANLWQPDYQLWQSYIPMPDCSYLAPCLTPAEVEARLAECREVVWQRLDKLEAEVAERERAAEMRLLTMLIATIQALPDHEDDRGYTHPPGFRQALHVVRAELARRREGT